MHALNIDCKLSRRKKRHLIKFVSKFIKVYVHISKFIIFFGEIGKRKVGKYHFFSLNNNN